MDDSLHSWPFSFSRFHLDYVHQTIQTWFLNKSSSILVCFHKISGVGFGDSMSPVRPVRPVMQIPGKILLDGAHNPHAAKELGSYVAHFVRPQPVQWIIALSYGKDAKGILQELLQDEDQGNPLRRFSMPFRSIDYFFRVILNVSHTDVRFHAFSRH